MIPTACLLITLPQEADIAKVLSFLYESNFNDFAVTSQPLNVLINFAFGDGVNHETKEHIANKGPTCVIAKVYGDLQQLYKQLIDNGFSQFIISSRPFYEVVSLAFATPPLKQVFENSCLNDYFCRPPTPSFTPPQSPTKFDENDSSISVKRRKISQPLVSSERARCQVCRKNVLGNYIKPEDIIRHAFYHANISRFVCVTCKKGSNRRSDIVCNCGESRKIIDLTNPAEATSDVTKLAKKCFPNAYELCF